MSLKGSVTILMISHDQNILNFCNKIFKVQSGKVSLIKDI